MSTESELYTLAFWKTTIARAISFAAATAASVLTNASFDGIKDVPWYGVISTAAMSGIIVLCTLVGGAAIRDAVPGDVTTREALTALRSTGRHAKPENNEPGA